MHVKIKRELEKLAELLDQPDEAATYTAELIALRNEVESLKANRGADPPALISVQETCRLTSLSRTTLLTRRRQGTFPAAVSLGDTQRIAFVRAEVMSWIEQRIASRQREAA